MPWHQIVLYAAVGWLTSLLATLVYLIFLIVFYQRPDGWIFVGIAGFGGIVGVLAVAAIQANVERRIQKNR
jgi:hypothetical protein